MEESKEFETVQLLETAENSEEIVMYNAQNISQLFNVNLNKSTDFLKKFGVRIGHWQIEKGTLLEVLQKNKGNLI